MCLCACMCVCVRVPLAYLAAHVMGTRWAAYTLKDSKVLTSPASWRSAVQQRSGAAVWWKLALKVQQ